MKWVASRKIAVLRDIENGVMNEFQACKKYDLSLEELLSWRKMYEQHGANGLKVRKLNRYR